MIAPVVMPGHPRISYLETRRQAAPSLELGETAHAMLARPRANDESDDLAPARGILAGLIIAVLIWAGLAALIMR
jgi:hypothetical protein